MLSNFLIDETCLTTLVMQPWESNHNYTHCALFCCTTCELDNQYVKTLIYFLSPCYRKSGVAWSYTVPLTASCGDSLPVFKPFDSNSCLWCSFISDLKIQERGYFSFTTGNEQLLKTFYSFHGLKEKCLQAKYIPFKISNDFWKSSNHTTPAPSTLLIVFFTEGFVLFWKYTEFSITKVLEKCKSRSKRMMSDKSIVTFCCFSLAATFSRFLSCLTFYNQHFWRIHFLKSTPECS